MRAWVVWMRRDQLAQVLLCFRKVPAAHVNICQPGQGIGVGIERESLFVLFHGVGIFFLLLKKKPRSEMRFGVFGLQSRGLMVRGKRLVRLAGFENVRQGKPCPLLTFCRLTCWLEMSRGAEK